MNRNSGVAIVNSLTTILGHTVNVFAEGGGVFHSVFERDGP